VRESLLIFAGTTSASDISRGTKLVVRKEHVVSFPGATLPFLTGRRFHLSQTVQNDGLSNSS
jgi:hypothetical protein